MVLNDEAHHCYLDTPAPGRREGRARSRRRRNEEAGVWFTGLQAIAKHVGIKQVYDLSATPFYLVGLRLQRGLHLPVDGQRLLADGRDRVRHRQGAPDPGRRRRRPTTSSPTCACGTTSASSSRSARPRTRSTDWLPPQGARGRAAQPVPQLREGVRPLGDGAQRSTARRRRSSSSSARTPSSASSSTTGSPASEVVEDDEVVAHKPGNLALLSNVVDGQPLARPRTILIDSAQLESGEAHEGRLQEGRRPPRSRRSRPSTAGATPAPTSTKITDEDLLREVMNTVGKKGKLGEQVRCVVSVSMLTEGWDANTVTHILGVRAFGSQLLCEQVVGRGLRRRSYAVERRRATSSRSTPTSTASRSSSSPPTSRSRTRCRPSRSIEVARARGPRAPADHLPQARRLPGRAPRRGHLARPGRTRPIFEIGPNTVPTLGRDAAASSASASSRKATRRSTGRRRSPSRSPSASSTTQFNTAGRQAAVALPEARRDLPGLDRADASSSPSGYSLGYLMTITEAQVAGRRAGLERDHPAGRQPPRAAAADAQPLRPRGLDRRRRLRHPQARPCPAEKSEVSHVTLDGKDGNTWEQLLASELELNQNVARVRQERPPRLHHPVRPQGPQPPYVPDFLVRLAARRRRRRRRGH